MTIYFCDSRVSEVGASGDGLAWERAFDTLEEALETAVLPCDEIWCKWCVLNRACGQATLYEGVFLYGGFPRHLRFTEGDKTKRPYKTVIDGGGAYRGLIMRSGSLVDGFEIRNCTADYGAGIYVYNPS